MTGKPMDDPDFRRARGRIGGIARAASQTPEEASALGRHAAEVRWAKHRAAKLAAGEPRYDREPREEPSATVLEYWLERVDAEFPDREWPNHLARRRAAILMMKDYLARLDLDARRKAATDD